MQLLTSLMLLPLLSLLLLQLLLSWTLLLSLLLQLLRLVGGRSHTAQWPLGIGLLGPRPLRLAVQSLELRLDHPVLVLRRLLFVLRPLWDESRADRVLEDGILHRLP